MGTITTLRPSSTSSGIGWTPSAGTLHGVTSDDNDATYATWGGSGSALILATPIDTPPAGERRHQVRLRARGEDGNAWWAVRLTSGTLVAAAAAEFPSSPTTVTGSWGFGAPPDGAIVLSTYVTGQSATVRIEELYIDMDSRLAPTFNPLTLDGSGASTTTISDTSQPVIRADSVDLDDLAARQYRYWVTLNGVTVWDTGITAGAATNRQTTALENGSYVAHLQIWSTLGADTAYASDEETLSFTVSVGTVPPPGDPTVTPLLASPLYEVEVCAADVSGFDDDQGWLEIQRVDCAVGGYLLLTGMSDSYASTPSGSAPTDLQVTVKAGRSDGWLLTPGTFETLAANWDQDAGEKGWHFVLGSDGHVALTWSPDGTAQLGAGSTDPVPFDPFGVARVRARLDTDNGAAGWTVTFETRDSDTAAWVQLGDSVTEAGTTSIFDTTAPYTVGAYLHTGAVVEQFAGWFYEVEVRDGAAGSVLVSPDFTGRPAGTASFTDGQLNVWTVHSPGQITSDQAITTVAILGPLETDECATYTDYTLPRTGAGTTCTHQPDLCCSYYRTRSIGRVDGQLLVSVWSDASGPLPDLECLQWSEDQHLIRTEGVDGVLWAAIGGEISWDVERPFTADVGVMGTRFVSSAPPGERNLKLTTAVETEAELAHLQEVLKRPLVLISPSDGREVWAAPVATSVRIIKIGRVRQVTADFIGTGPQPPPQLADVGA